MRHIGIKDLSEKGNEELAQITGFKKIAIFDFDFPYVYNMFLNDKELVVGMDKVVAFANTETKSISFFTPLTTEAENDIRQLNNIDEFILSVDGTFVITAGEKDFWRSCKELLSTWGFKVLNYKSGLVETPYGKSGLNMCFSTSQKAVLLVLYLKMKEPDMLCRDNLPDCIDADNVCMLEADCVIR